MSRMIIAGVGLAVVIAGAGYYAVKNGGMAASGEVNVPSSIEFKSDADKALYGFASRQGQQVKSSLQQLTDLGIEVDESLLVKGFHDGLKGTVALTEEEQIAAMQAFSTDLEARAEAKKTELAAASKDKNNAFFVEFDKQEGVTKTESGLRYIVVQPGDGKTFPTLSDRAVVHYRGTLTDGTQFDSSYDRGQPATFGVGQVIKGWTEALLLMSKGAKFKLAIPSELAYGEGGAGDTIPPGAVLVFDVELLDVQRAGESAQQ